MITKLIRFSVLTIFTLFFLNSCGLYKRSDVKDNPVNVDERVRKNIQEGRSFRFGKGATRGGDFDFASSNPLWRSAVSVLDFVPLTNASYSGGIIITEWFSSENNTENTNRELKITVRFMSNEIKFLDMSKLVEKVLALPEMGAYETTLLDSIDDIINLNRLTRQISSELII